MMKIRSIYYAGDMLICMSITPTFCLLPHSKWQNFTDLNKFVFMGLAKKKHLRCVKALNGYKLDHSEHVKYLGIYTDKFLDWSIKILENKLSRTNGIFSKLRHLCPKETLVSVYYSLFYPHLTYACPVWILTSKKNLQSLNDEDIVNLNRSSSMCLQDMIPVFDPNSTSYVINDLAHNDVDVNFHLV